MATLFTKDVEVLATVRSGLLVHMQSVHSIFLIISFNYLMGLIFSNLTNLSCSLICLMEFYVKLPQFVSGSQPINALAYIFDGLHYGI